jgi:hypothetical protein
MNFEHETFPMLIVDLLSAPQKHCYAYENVVDRFKILIKSSILHNVDIAVQARKLVQQYSGQSGDQDGNVFPAEFTQFVGWHAKAKN